MEPMSETASRGGDREGGSDMQNRWSATVRKERGKHRFLKPREETRSSGKKNEIDETVSGAWAAHLTFVKAGFAFPPRVFGIRIVVV